MAYEEEGIKEKISGKSLKPSFKMTLQKAIDMGEYDPDFLSTFPEWHELSRHIQFQMIKTALDNRERQLTVQWAEIVNFLDFRLKPHLKEALENVQKQLKASLRTEKDSIWNIQNEGKCASRNKQVYDKK